MLAMSEQHPDIVGGRFCDHAQALQAAGRRGR
jgi:hypothetical protein